MTFLITLQYIATVCRMKTKYVFAFCNLFLKIDLNCDLMLPNLTCLLIYSLAKCCILEDVSLNDTCSEKFVILAEKYP